MTVHPEKGRPAGDARDRRHPRHSAYARSPLRRTAPAGFLLLVLVAASGVLFTQYRRTVDLERAATAREAMTVIGAVEAGVHVHARHGAQYIEDRLADFLERLVESSPAKAILLATSDGRSFMRAGEAALLADPSMWTEAAIDASWMPYKGLARFYMTMTPLQEPRGPGSSRIPRGREQWVDLPQEEFRIAVAIDAADLEDRIAAARIRLGAGVGILVAVAVLAAVLYTMRERHRALEEQLWRIREDAAQQERLARLGAGLAHETRNPLGLVRGLMQSISSHSGSAEPVRRMAQTAIDEVDRTVGRISSFLQLARPVEPSLEPVHLAPLLEEVAGLMSTEAPEGVLLRTDCRDARLSVLADSDMLRRALFNLGINAIAATDAPGEILFRADCSSGDKAVISVHDTGRGIAPEDLPRVTEPYFTRSKGGSGLGLAIVDRIARAHGWQLRIESEPGEGAEVFLTGLIQTDAPCRGDGA